MKISTKGQYALRLMMDVAEHDGIGFVSLKDVAARENLSIKYLEQIAGTLSKSGMLQSGRGAQGGYRLSKVPEKYTVGSILRLTEGSLAPVACMGGEDRCKVCCECSTPGFWAGLYGVINEYIDRYTLADLLKEQTQKK